MHFQAIQVSSFSKQSKSRYSPGFVPGPRFFPCSTPLGKPAHVCNTGSLAPYPPHPCSQQGRFPSKHPLSLLWFLSNGSTSSSRRGSGLLSWARWAGWRGLPCLALSRGALQMRSFFFWTLLSMPVSEAWSLQSHRPPAGGESVTWKQSPDCVREARLGSPGKPASSPPYRRAFSLFQANESLLIFESF